MATTRKKKPTSSRRPAEETTEVRSAPSAGSRRAELGSTSSAAGGAKPAAPAEQPRKKAPRRKAGKAAEPTLAMNAVNETADERPVATPRPMAKAETIEPPSPVASATHPPALRRRAGATTSAELTRIEVGSVVAAPRPALPSSSDLHKMVSDAAYYRAEHRGFAPGHDVEDWLAAEREIEAELRTTRAP